MRMQKLTRIAYAVITAACVAYTLVDHDVGSVSISIVVATWTVGRILTEGIHAIIDLGKSD